MAKKQTKKPAATKKAAGLNKPKKRPTHVNVRFLALPASKYRIAGNIGQVKSLPINQAQEIIDNGDAELVK